MSAGIFVRFCLRFYALLALTGLVLMAAGGSLAVFWIAPPRVDAALAWMLGIPALSLLCSLLLLRMRMGRGMLTVFHGLLPSLDPSQRLLVAMASGLGEEILFRGALLPFIGLTLSSLAFGLLHWPVKPSLRPWTVYAVLMGLLLGRAAELCQSIWVPVLAHTLTNFAGFTLIEAQRPAMDEPESQSAI